MFFYFFSLVGGNKLDCSASIKWHENDPWLCVVRVRECVDAVLVGRSNVTVERAPIQHQQANTLSFFTRIVRKHTYCYKCIIPLYLFIGLRINSIAFCILYIRISPRFIYKLYGLWIYYMSMCDMLKDGKIRKMLQYSRDNYINFPLLSKHKNQYLRSFYRVLFTFRLTNNTIQIVVSIINYQCSKYYSISPSWQKK